MSLKHKILHEVELWDFVDKVLSELTRRERR